MAQKQGPDKVETGQRRQWAVIAGKVCLQEGFRLAVRKALEWWFS